MTKLQGRQSYLVAVIGTTKAALAQCFAETTEKANRAVEALFLDSVGEPGVAQCIDSDAAVGTWIVGDAAYVRSVIEDTTKVVANVLGHPAAKPFYIWANEDCANSTHAFWEAKRIRASLIQDGAEDVYIADADGVEVVDAEIEADEAKAANQAKI